MDGRNALLRKLRVSTDFAFNCDDAVMTSVVDQAPKWAQSAFHLGVDRWSENLQWKNIDLIELAIRIVDEDEMCAANKLHRGIDKPTNVLSFTFDQDIPASTRLLGDLLLCAQVIESQAQQSGLQLLSHYAHMVTHGVLHLCGFDHEDEDSAEEMESLEITALAALDIGNPYSAEMAL